MAHGDVGVGEIFPIDEKKIPFVVSTLQGEAARIQALAAQLVSLFVTTSIYSFAHQRVLYRLSVYA